jgi:AcrR family transcriptional regulator
VHDKFLNLSKDKQDKIINAALKTFSASSYKKASTDDIVMEAGISKGSLFHYFGNKENLYIFLYDYVIDVLLEEYYAKIDLQECDIFEKLKNLATIKMEMLNKYPDTFNFLMNAMQENNPDIRAKIQSKIDNEMVKNMKLFLENIDQSKFRDDIDKKVAIEMIMLTFEGYASNELLKMKKTGFNQKLSTKWLNDLDKYINVMKKIYYKGV